MKILPVLILLFLATSFQAAVSKDPKLKEKAAETKFLREVESAVRVHDADQLLKFMEPNYKRSQHDEFLEGRTVQFLNEFFCSEVLFNEITEVRLQSYKLQEKSKTDYEVTFYLKSDKAESTCTFFMKKHTNSNTFSIYSAVG